MKLRKAIQCGAQTMKTWNSQEHLRTQPPLLMMGDCTLQNQFVKEKPDSATSLLWFLHPTGLWGSAALLPTKGETGASFQLLVLLSVHIFTLFSSEPPPGVQLSLGICLLLRSCWLTALFLHTQSSSQNKRNLWFVLVWITILH
uniref:Uncharacterized protein n=1 Tax=Mus spicilegus TaxID=10103 RepID=A0A8C6GN96_MUSSI